MTSTSNPMHLTADSLLFMIEDNRVKAAIKQFNELQDHAAKVKILAADNVVFELTAHGGIKTVVDILTASSPEERALILLAPKAVLGLAEKKHAQTAITMIKSLPNDSDRLNVLMAQHAVFGLTSYHKAEAVMSIIEELPHNLQKQILADDNILHSLKVYKQGAAIERIEESWRREVAQRLKKEAAALIPKPK